ncbi:hypothetical protein PEC18_36205 [Paucibacter sp. O1-1]|nr:hypothetical protein [Paucibacter sp. O1-1]MDA3831097.1 hypothetical protein [Paucibacter sp. O1-1]
MTAVHRLTHLLLSLAAAALFSGQSLAQGAQPASAPATTPTAQQAGEGDAVQRVLRDLARGQNARPAIQALKDPAPAGPGTGRAQEARQFDAAQQQLIEALRAYPAQRGSLEALRAHYDAWRAAALIVQVQMDSQGERLQQSADGAAYVGKHAQARNRVSAALAQVQGLLDPMLVGGTASAKSASQPLAPTGSRQSAEDALAALQKLQTRHRETSILRAQPVPFGGLNLAPRQPVSAPTVVPSYETAGEVTPMPADRDSSAHAPLDEEILARAKALDNDYVRIYEFVRNQTRNEWYAGSVKGALGVLRSGAGNDVDQASLLTALLRAAGLNTRYVQGVVEVPLERLAAELGVPAGDVNAVPLALGKAGVAFSPVVRGGRVAAVQLARTWVSAYVPYTNYRGALVDASGKSWIPLDPYYKSYQYQASPGFFGRSFSAAGLSREFLARTQTGTFADFLRTRLGNALATAGTGGPAGTWQGQRGVAQSDTLQLDILPNSLPYSVAAVTREGADLPSTELATVRIRLQQGARADDAVVLDKTLPLAAVGNARLTLSYGPASLEDHRVALLYGGMDGVPLYLIGLRGQLKLGGELVGTATDKVDPGASLRLTLTLKGPWGEQEVEQTVMAGAHHALLIGNDPQRPATTAASDSDHQGVKLLDGLGLYYTRQWNEADRDIAGWLDAGLVRPLPAVTLVSTTLRPAYVAGVPVTLEWTGVSLDAALRPVDGVGAGAPDVLTLSALAGSSLEQGVFRDQFSVEAMSADRGVQLARERGLAVLELDGGNLAQIDTTDHADNVKQAVRDLVGQGFAVRIPAATLTQQAWSGSVWQAWQGTRAGFFLSGGLAGGTSVEAPEVWTLGFLADVFRSMETEEANKDPRSGVRVVALGASSGQRGVAGEALPVPYTVLVTDKLGRPVKNAQVSFSVITGDAKVGGGGSTTVPTNVIGMASVPVTLGQSTGINPVWIMRNEGDEAATRVGAISVDVQVDSAIGPLRPDEPMSALLLPGPLSALNSKSEVPDTGLPAATVGVLSLGTEDQYGNPVANVQVNFSISGQAQSSCATGPGGKYRQGALWNAFASANACPGGAVLGQCGQASLQLKSVSNGVVYAGVILSNEIKGSNTVTANAGGVSRTFNFTNTGYCEPFADRAVYYGMLSTQGGESDGEGQPGGRHRARYHLWRHLPGRLHAHRVGLLLRCQWQGALRSLCQLGAGQRRPGQHRCEQRWLGLGRWPVLPHQHRRRAGAPRRLP